MLKTLYVTGFIIFIHGWDMRGAGQNMINGFCLLSGVGWLAKGLRGWKDDGGTAEPRKLRAGWVGRKQGHFVGRTWGWGAGQLLAEGR